MATFASRRVTAWAVGAGIATGLVVAVPLAALNISPLGLNPGFVGLVANVAVMAVISLTTRHATVVGPVWRKA
ncbi:MAG: hypothetical protein WB810_01080 [Candidatus Cybelea sp.]